MKPTSQSFLRHPLSAILANPAAVRVLTELCRHGGEMSSSQLITLTRMSRPSVLAALEHLTACRVVQALGAARQRLHRVDPAHPLVPHLSALFEAEDQRYHAILDAVRGAARKAGARAAWLYGSVARGEDRPDSDLDVAIVAAPGVASAVRDAVQEALRGAEERLSFSPSLVGIDLDDVARLAAEDDPWWRDVVRDAVPLHGQDPAALAARLATQRARGAA